MSGGGATRPLSMDGGAEEKVSFRLRCLRKVQVSGFKLLKSQS